MKIAIVLVTIIAVVAIGLVANSYSLSHEPSKSKVVLANGTTTVVNNYYNNGYSWLPFYYWLYAPHPNYYGSGFTQAGSTFDYYGQQVRSITPEESPASQTSNIGTDAGTEGPDNLGSPSSSAASSSNIGAGGKDVGGEASDTVTGSSSSSDSGSSSESSSGGGSSGGGDSGGGDGGGE